MYKIHKLKNMVHNFFESALRAMLDDVYTKLKPFEQHIQDSKFPVMIMNTGDEVYLSNMQPDTGTVLYQRVPRLTFDAEGLNIATDQLTNPNIFGTFTDDSAGFKSEKKANFRRIPINFSMNAQVYFSNIFQFFTFTEILLMQSYRHNPFDFYYQGKLMRGVYNYQDNLTPDVNKSLGFDSEKRQRVMNLSFEVELQYPAFDFYGSTTLLDASTRIESAEHRLHPDGRLVDNPEVIDVPQADC